MKRLCLCVVVLAVGATHGGARADRARAEVAIKVAPGHIDFMIGKELVTRYHTGANVAKPYFWPLIGPGGRRLTRAWPMEKGYPGQSTDHVHQKSAWFCHGDVIPEGVELKQKVKGVAGVDFWSEASGHGRIVLTHVGEPKVHEGHASIVTRNSWRTADGIEILDENRTIHFHHFGDTQLIVLEIDLTAAVPVTFGDTKEGSMGIRINDSIRGSKGKLENADGKVGEGQCWGRQSPWCDYSGSIDDQVVGLALLEDPANAARACWHSRSYGLMAANPFGRAKSGFPAMKGNNELVKLAKGEHLKLRYGLLLHPGDAKSGKVAEYYERFVKLNQSN